MLAVHFGDSSQKIEKFTSPDLPLNLLALLLDAKKNNRFEICDHIQIDTGAEGIDIPLHIINYYFENKMVSVFAMPSQSLSPDYWRVCFVDNNGYLMV